MNSPFIIDVVRRIMNRPEIKPAFAARDLDGAIRAIYQVVFQRTPTPAELEKAKEFLLVELKHQKEIEKQQSELLARSQQRAEQLLEAERTKSTVAARAAVINEGELVARVALTPWETLVQALLFSNEAAYLN
jgi:hypothetical protein